MRSHSTSQTLDLHVSLIRRKLRWGHVCAPKNHSWLLASLWKSHPTYLILLSGMIYVYQQTLWSALTCVASLLRFWGYHLQVMNAPPYLPKPPHKPLPPFPQGLLCLCVSVFVCTFSVCVCVGVWSVSHIWLTTWLSYLGGNSEGLLESPPNCEVNDVRQLTHAVFLHIHLSVGKTKREWTRLITETLTTLWDVEYFKQKRAVSPALSFHLPMQVCIVNDV